MDNRTDATGANAVADPLYPPARSNQASPLQNMTQLELAGVAQSESSQARSRQRCSRPTPIGWQYLNDLGEGTNFWFALRKHAPHQVCMEILQELSTHSRWLERRATDDEELRNLYHQHCRNIRYFDPDWQDAVMAERSKSADAAQASAHRSDTAGSN